MRYELRVSKTKNPANNIILLKVMMLKNKSPMNFSLFCSYKNPFKVRKKKNKINVSGFTKTNEVNNVGSHKINTSPAIDAKFDFV